MMKRFSTVFIVWLIASPSSAGTIILNNLETDKRLSLGQGYDPYNNVFVDSCWTGNIVYSGEQSAEIVFDHTTERDDLIRDVKTNGGAGIGSFFLSGSVSTELSSILHERRWRETLIYRSSYRGKVAILQDPQLKTEMKKLSEEDPSLFRALCGTQFVSKIYLGGSLYYFVHLDFFTKNQRDLFKTKVRVQTLGFAQIKTIPKEFENTDRSVVVQIEARQIGGRPERLAGLLKSHKSRCSFEDIKACDEMFSALEAYALGSCEEAFPAQMYAGMAGAAESGYQNIIRAVEVDGDEINDRSKSIENITQRLSIVESDERLVNNRLPFYPQDSQSYQQLLEIKNNEIRPLKDLLLRLAQRCKHAKQQSCDIEDYLPSVHWERSVGVRERLNEDSSFVDYCLLSHLDESTTRLTNAVLHALGFSDRNRKTCEIAAVRLGSLTHLNLHGLKIQSLEPLADAKKIEFLDASENDLEDLSFLRDWQNLSYLNIRKNQLKSLFGLTNLMSLRYLNAAYNNLSDTRSIKNPGLEIALFHGNPSELTSDAASNGQLFISSEDDLCAWQRRNLLDLGWYDIQSFEAYENVNFLPFIEGDHIHLKPCAIGASLLDEAAIGLFPKE